MPSSFFASLPCPDFSVQCHPEWITGQFVMGSPVISQWQEEATTCQTDRCCCPVDTSSLFLCLFFFLSCFSTLAQFVFHVLHCWLLFGVAKDGQQSSVKLTRFWGCFRKLDQNNTQLGLMKWFSFLPFYFFSSIVLYAQMSDRKRRNANNYLIKVTQMQCICFSTIISCLARSLMWPIPPLFLTAEFSSSSPSNDSIIRRLKIVPLWHIWCLHLGSRFSWITLSCVY